MKAMTTKTKTVGGVKWECSEAEGMWFSGEWRICRSDRKGLRSQWELFKGNERKANGQTCGDLMEMVARNAV